MCSLSYIGKANDGPDSDCHFRGTSWGVCPFRESREMKGVLRRVALSFFRFVKVYRNVKWNTVTKNKTEQK